MNGSSIDNDHQTMILADFSTEMLQKKTFNSCFSICKVHFIRKSVHLRIQSDNHATALSNTDQKLQNEASNIRMKEDVISVTLVWCYQDFRNRRCPWIHIQWVW